MEWWGYSKERGWVVLDRSIASNAPGLKRNLLFFCCRDSTTFFEQHARWNPPLYRFAPNYIRDLTPDEAIAATGELKAFKAAWPAFQPQVQRAHVESEAGDRASALVEAEKPKVAAPIVPRNFGQPRVSARKFW